MARRIRLIILTSCNWLFWAAMFALTWHNMIPERLTMPSFLLSQLFAIPLGCCSLWFLINAHFHEMGWRLWVTAIAQCANGVLWAWCIDWLWKWHTNRATRGFEVVESKGDDA